jgi:hypothetical protein
MTKVRNHPKAAIGISKKLATPIAIPSFNGYALDP